jgi:5-deoxy-5-amino-3-dehydroquinate synthase
MAHGEAVAVGLVYAAHLAHRLGRIDPARVERHYDVVGGSYELGTSLPSGLSATDLVGLMSRDKKVLSDGLTFVLDGPDGVEVVAGVDPALALAALADMR